VTGVHIDKGRQAFGHPIGGIHRQRSALRPPKPEQVEQREDIQAVVTVHMGQHQCIDLDRVDERMQRREGARPGIHPHHRAPVLDQVTRGRMARCRVGAVGAEDGETHPASVGAADQRQILATGGSGNWVS